MNNLEIANNSIQLASNALILIGAFIGVVAMNKWHEKQTAAAFSFLSNLKARVKNLYDMFTNDNFKNHIKNRFLPLNLRQPVTDVYYAMADDYIKLFSNKASETMKFLMEADNQYPPKGDKDWAQEISFLMEFLEDVEMISNKNYCKWNNAGDFDIYYSNHTQNMDTIISKINAAQQHLSIMERVKKRFKRKK